VRLNHPVAVGDPYANEADTHGAAVILPSSPVPFSLKL